MNSVRHGGRLLLARRAAGSGVQILNLVVFTKKLRFRPRLGLFAALLLTTGFSRAEGSAPLPAFPFIREIVFEGNDTTQPKTMLRELVIHNGDPAEPGAIERSRQGIQDLGLFRSVEVEQRPYADGVQLVFRVREKYYIVPSPRADANSDGQYAYGVQLRWYNVWGLNHTLRTTLKYRNRQEADRGTALVFSGGYSAPLVFDSPYSVSASGAYSREPVESVQPYDEVTANTRVTLSRTLWNEGPASQGATAGIGVQWQEQTTDGDFAPPPQGHAIALVLNGGYSSVRNKLYSEEGYALGFEILSAGEKFGSDYAFNSAGGSFDGSWAVGETPHQTLGIFARAGTYHGGVPGSLPPFDLGGVDSLRGYRRQVLRGDGFYYGGVEFLRPLRWNWLRSLAFIEAGDIIRGDGKALVEGPFADIGIGVRTRLTWFVRVDLSLGVAWPLVDAGDGGGMRVFAGGS